MFAVASSSRIILFFRSIARQMHINCFSPELRLPPFSVIARSSSFLAGALALGLPDSLSVYSGELEPRLPLVKRS